MNPEFDGIDGPYIVGEKIYRVTKNKKLISAQLETTDSIDVTVDNVDHDQFSFSLRKEYDLERSSYPMPKKLIVIADIEGNFNGFLSFLVGNKVVDLNLNWIFESNHLLLCGDLIDRGIYATQVLWLVYKLEQEAAEKGGKVHLILGNHEIMNFQGNVRYNHEKYIKVALEISGKERPDRAVQFMFSDKTELGKWLRTKNVIKKIGDYIFVHAGLHPEILEYDLNLEEINEQTRASWDTHLYTDEKVDEVANFLTGNKCLYWYRGLATDHRHYDKIHENELNKILDYYRAKKIVIGHTVVDDISTDFNGKVVKIDILHEQDKNTGLTKGLLIENGIQYKVNDKGHRETF